MRTKEKTSISLSPEVKQLLVRLSEKLGLSQAGIIEMSVRKLAEVEKIPRSNRG